MIQIIRSNIKRSWTKADIEAFFDFIAQSCAIEETSKHLGRTVPSIISKGNRLGYGHKTKDGIKYFTEKINHKNRRTKEEILEGKEFVSVSTENKESQGTDIEVDTILLPKKVEINIVDLEIIIYILTVTKEKAVAARSKSRGGSLNDSEELLTTKDMYVN